jgi:hypothetical protein
MSGRGAGVGVTGTAVASTPAWVAIATEIAAETLSGSSDDGDHILKTVAEPTATMSTTPIWRMDWTSDEPMD